MYAKVSFRTSENGFHHHPTSSIFQCLTTCLEIPTDPTVIEVRMGVDLDKGFGVWTMLGVNKMQLILHLRCDRLSAKQELLMQMTALTTRLP